MCVSPGVSCLTEKEAGKRNRQSGARSRDNGATVFRGWPSTWNSGQDAYFSGRRAMISQLISPLGILSSLRFLRILGNPLEAAKHRPPTSAGTH